VLFLNTALLLGALGIAIPVIIHLLNRRSSRVVDWGAMNFLLESLAIRNRRIQLEEALLMATRCLLVGLLALALARPFVPPDSTIPWIVVLPLLLFAVVGFGVAVVLHDEPKWRRRIAVMSALLLLACVALVFFEKYLNLSRCTPGAKQDIALIIDGSTSMSVKTDGKTNFERAVEEARELVERAPRGHAFSLILGGPSPTGLVLDPTTDRTELEAALEELTPIDGAMATYQAFTLASLGLARGDHPAKQIVLLTDEQDIGWEIGKSGRWNFLRDAFANLPSEPRIMVRSLPLPDYVRNVAVTDVALSREIVGVDRPVEVSVTVENTGNEAVTPDALALRADDGREQRNQSLGQLLPGERRTVTFSHQFSEPGAHSLAAALEVDDDIAGDDIDHLATNVADELKVLIVDGRPSARAFERASTFAAVALAPSALTLDPSLEPNAPGVSDEASDDFDADYDPTLEQIRFLVEPQVIDAPDVATITDFDSFDAVILGDVPRLPSLTAASLAEYVEKGGGLLVAAGTEARADFYNEWQVKDDTPLMPAKLDARPVVGGDEFFSPSPRTLTHPALEKVSDSAESDFSDATITHYRSQTIPESLAGDSSVGARLDNGDILLSSRRAGEGRVVLLGVPLDLSAGNLVTRQAFLPFLHELVYHLAAPATHQLNLEPGWEIGLDLTGKGGRAIGQGLIGHYYADPSAKEPAYTRRDDNLEFNWLRGNPAPGVPSDHFRVEWRGSLRVPDTARYTFTTKVDDQLTIHLDGKKMGPFRKPGGRRKMSAKLEADRWYDFRAVFREKAGNASAVLYWESEDLPTRPIASEFFRTFSPDEDGEEDRSILTTYEVTGPDDTPRAANLESSGEGSVLELQGKISSGLYRLTIPEKQEPYFAEFLRPDSREIPFTVARNDAESHLDALSEEDYAFLADFVSVAKPRNLDELIGFLQGKQFGQELWKYLAIGALVFLLVEVALARWIARSRRLGEEITVRFESKDTPTGAFREQLARMGKT